MRDVHKSVGQDVPLIFYCNAPGCMGEQMTQSSTRPETFKSALCEHYGLCEHNMLTERIGKRKGLKMDIRESNGLDKGNQEVKSKPFDKKAYDKRIRILEKIFSFYVHH